MKARPVVLLAGVSAVLMVAGLVARAAAQERPRPFNPVITSLSPSSGEPGAIVDAVLRGADLGGATIQVSGGGVRVLDASVQDPATHFLRIFIDPDATPGPRALSVTVTAGRMTRTVSTTFSILRRE